MDELPDTDGRTRGATAAHGLAGSIGAFWGGVFGLPFLLGAGLFPLAGLVRDRSALVFAAMLALAFLSMVLAGRWWARERMGEWTIVTAAAAQGLLLWLQIAVVPFSRIALHTPPPDPAEALGGWGAFSLWSLAAAATIRRRLRHASGIEADDDAAAAPVAARPPSRWLGDLALPLLLCAPFVLVLRHGAVVRESANASIEQRIRAIEAEASDLRDVDKVRNAVLARKPIVEAIDPRLPRALDALDVAGRLPDEAHLLTLDMRRERLVLSFRLAADARGVLDLLGERGYRHPRIVASRPERGAVPVDVEAESAREEDP